MTIAIMQPYLFPYIGYWQLIKAVDKFVILDDVNYIMRGYINRNLILLDGKPYRFSIPIEKASQNKLIMDTKICFSDSDKKKLIHTIESAYHRAPCFNEVFPIIENIILFSEENLTEYIINSITEILKYVDINTEILVSSKLDKHKGLKAEERIIDICRCLNANTYINASGGRELYSHSEFERYNLKLFFLDVRTKNVEYMQYGNAFVENLSIIDVLMFNDTFTIQKMLMEYDLNI